MKNLTTYFALFLLGGVLFSCQEFLAPEEDNALTREDIIANPSLAEGILLKAYQELPNDIFGNLDLAIASDEATGNLITSNIVAIATGGWQAANDPLAKWDYAYKNIQYVNRFLEIADEVRWSTQDPSLDQLFRQRLVGEAHGLRAYYQMLLLQHHAGVTTDGQLLGFPIVLEPLTIDDNLFLPRNTYQECLAQIMSDCDVAIQNIAASYANADPNGGNFLNGRVEAEDYDEGGQGVGYNDADPENNIGGQYRSDGVDIERVTGESGFNVGWTNDGEWLNYTQERIFAGRYNITARMASNSGAPGQLRILIGDNSASLEEVAIIQAGNTGGWQTWQEFTVEGIQLEGGTNQVIRFEIVNGGFNLDYVSFDKTDPFPSPSVAFNGQEYSVLTYDRAMGARWRNRFTGSAGHALKARAALYGASPAYQAGSGVNWENAAAIAGAFLAGSGGLDVVTPNGITYYQNSLNEDIIWNNSQVFANNSNRSNWEQQNFPPSLFGLGRTNPSHNLAASFPMDNGFPIDNPNSGYDDFLPYIGRDARFYAYLISNGSFFKGRTIGTSVNNEIDGINALDNSTRTGYYLRKFMDETVNLEAGRQVATLHHYTHLRFTEVLLNYAEAANEAWGPDGDPNGYGFTARQVISALRGRAGISQPDAYLISRSGKEAMRTLIRNERKLELCFEGHRFWDLRRWNDLPAITQPIQGVFIDANTFQFDVRNIENRPYQDYMIYGPIPLDEVLKYDIQQNRGW
ncbi:RagB/SusD family nutrient uptake outer membrane protein [Neolewinella lacunae]|uniref:RagB/SusD family nutrient uptake outer membrane protein n=1 Tax=Neolewinella lacunae TaxID=1517758 RepID=A0A923TCZ0_9BACT|nr:RagB/SusD family nutrient uptake outer membrane protein [Neolewinella lacunae]MBC6994257.1 RagB/SusD family nutrient uptake outer membrane protein [Neolewinella lacunae]MDN3637125.1 RagB/SusD family nutrient uptake outer membrane protein [Neolewinella lacunae]